MNPWWKQTSSELAAKTADASAEIAAPNNPISTSDANSDTDARATARKRRTPRTKSAARTETAAATAAAQATAAPAAAPRRARRKVEASDEPLVTADDVITESLDDEGDDDNHVGTNGSALSKDDDAPKRRRRRPRKARAVLESIDEPLPELRTPVSMEPGALALIEALREALLSTQQFSGIDNDERRIALFCDLENLVLGLRDGEQKKFDINLVLERLREKGKIIVKKAYADWERYSEFKRDLHDAAIELIDIPHKKYSGKNSADIKMVVDAMELASSNNHLDTFVVLSGDSDFSPLVSKLRENNNYVIGIGVKNSSSRHLIDNCDEFIFYEDIWRDNQHAPQLEGLDKKQTEVFTLMNESIKALVRENKDVLWGSMIKQTMQRKRPSFNEGYFGYSSFSELLEEAQRRRIINLKKDSRSGSYIVTGFARS